MTVRPIRITGDPVLHTPASPVTVFDDELRKLVQDMFETMDKAPGVGLAAPQIGVPLRVFVYDYASDSGEERRGVVINPTLEIGPVSPLEPDEETESEGCLSVPGERFALKRADRATVTGVDLDQKPVKIEARGWFARIFQHEFDHLEGTLYVDRLRPEIATEASKAIERNGWGKPGASWLPGQDHLEG